MPSSHQPTAPTATLTPTAQRQRAMLLAALTERRQQSQRHQRRQQQRHQQPPTHLTPRAYLLLLLATLSALLLLPPIQPAPSQNLAAATAARHSQRYDRALTFYAAAIQQTPADPQPHCLTAQVYALQRLWPAAAAAYQRCAALAAALPFTTIHQSAWTAAAWLGLGDTLIAQSAERGAHTLDGLPLDTTALSPTDAHLIRAERSALIPNLLYQSVAGDPTGANAAALAWQRAAALGQPAALRRLGLLHEAQGRFADAQRDWALLPANDPQAQASLGLIALQRGDATAARAHFLIARAQPNAFAGEITDNGFVQYAALPLADPSWYLLLGRAFTASGLPSLALHPLRAALALDPTNAIAHTYLGWALWQTGQRPTALPEITRSLQLDPPISLAPYAAGIVALATGRSLALPSPASPPAAALAQFTLAQTLFERALHRDPQNPAILAALASALLAQRAYIPADLALTTAATLSTDPTYSIALLRFYLQYSYGLTDDHALHSAIAAVARFPTNEPLRYQLAQLYDLTGQPSSAYYTALAAHTLDPTDPGPLLLLGQFASAQGQYVTAALDLRAALALRPTGPLAAQARDALAPLTAIPV